MSASHVQHEPADPPMRRTYWLVVLVEIIVVAGLWAVGRYFGG
jgi:hypothetical protein